LVIHCHTYTFVCVTEGTVFSCISTSLTIIGTGVCECVAVFVVCVYHLGSLLSHLVVTCISETMCLEGYVVMGRDNVFGIATRYGLDGTGIESQLGVRFSETCPDRPWSAPSLLGKVAGALR
jgi:hypothetical protein